MISHWPGGARTSYERLPYCKSLIVNDKECDGGKIIEVLDKFLSLQRKEKIATILESRTYSILPVLDNIHDDGNIQAVIRSAENFGYQGLHIIKSEKIKKNKGPSCGSEKWIDLYPWKDRTQCLKHLKDLGYAICATTLSKSSLALEDIPITKPLAIFFGNEKDGVSTEILQEADFSCQIKTNGFSQSLNISVAAAICFFWFQQKRIQAFGKQGDLTSEQKEILKAFYYIKSFKKSHYILKYYLDL